MLAGIRSASSDAVGLIASPETAVAAHEGLISVQYPMNFDTNVGVSPGSEYPGVCFILLKLCNWMKILCAMMMEL